MILDKLRKQEMHYFCFFMLWTSFVIFYGDIFWQDLDVDDFLEEFGIEFDDLKRMKMRDIIREIGPCQR